jgi:hypothetical protein
MKMEIEFPDDESYGKCLSRLRKALTPNIPNLHVRGDARECSLVGLQRRLVPLILPNDYRIFDWNPDMDASPLQRSAVK